MEADIVKLGAAQLVNGVPTWQGSTPVGDAVSDVEPLGDLDAYQALGFASMPAAADGNGAAEAVIIRDCSGRVAVCIGGRDSRNADIVGNLKPGDCAMFATGPGAVAQVQCKAEKRQVVLATETPDGDTMAFVLDGKNKKAQLAAIGAMLEIDDDGDFALINSSGYGILIQADGIHFRGPVHFAGIRPGMALMQGPQTGSPGGGAAAPMFAVPGVGG